MTCVFCHNGETKRGLTKVHLSTTTGDIIVHEVPADICENCGEAYIDTTTAKKLEKIALEAEEKGVKLEVLSLTA
ncbi:MAG TPA: type II toxin-antitoxin system MqsA family antitoxin [Phnomibacter sp.]|nr:type II toxin-antitoxin system MqsA family antitoxin [Phnomibacter sp.]